MAGNRLNVLSVGSNPNLLYYSWKLQSSGKFNIHTVNEDLDVSSPASVKDHNGDFQFQPDILVNDFKGLTVKANYDIILLSSKSLQDISNIATSLTPFLNKNSIILIESTGFVNLETFLKNCFPSSLQLFIFSIMTSIDIRKLSQNQYYLLPTKREIYIGESSTSPSKFTKTSQQNLNALSKLFQHNNKDDLKVILKSTYLDFLVEEWKFAIPRICFDPLLILFEEKTPSKLSNQILAKPLLSGLATELITVAKTMGCKLPAGFDNESNFFKNWSDCYENKESPVNVDYIESPSLFYNFYHKMDLNIDLLLLQPILLADDYGIKTPYLEFLYATICQYHKLNTPKSSIFFQRLEDSESANFKQQLKQKSAQLDQQRTEQEKLIIKNQELSQNYARIEADLQNVKSVVEAYEQLKVKKSETDQQLLLSSKRLEDAELKLQQLQRRNQSLESQSANSGLQGAIVSKSIPTQKSASRAPLTKSFEDPTNEAILQEGLQQNVQNQPGAGFVSDGGTPDLRDLTDVAVYSGQFDEPSSSQPQQGPLQEDGNVPPISQSSPPSLKLQIPGSLPQGLPQALSNREIELKRREQLLMNREMELSKKLSGINLNRMNGPSGPVQGQPHPQVHHGGPHQQQPQYISPPPAKNLHNKFNSISQSVPQGPSQQPQPQFQLQPPIQPRRVSTMPILESDQMFNGVGGPGGMNGQSNGVNLNFKKTSRKNRKSSFPMVSTSNLGDGFGNIIPNNGAGGSAPKRFSSNPNQNPQGPAMNGGPISHQSPPQQNFNNNAPPPPPTQNGQFPSSQHTGVSHPPQIPNQSMSQLHQPPRIHLYDTANEPTASSNNGSNTNSNNGSSSSFQEKPSSQQSTSFTNVSTSSGNGYEGLSQSNSGTDLNGSVIHLGGSNDEVEAVPLGAVLDSSKKSETGKKKFGLFKKKKQ